MRRPTYNISSIKFSVKAKASYLLRHFYTKCFKNSNVHTLSNNQHDFHQSANESAGFLVAPCHPKK